MFPPNASSPQTRPPLPFRREAPQKGGEAAQRGARPRREPREPGWFQRAKGSGATERKLKPEGVTKSLGGHPDGDLGQKYLGAFFLERPVGHRLQPVGNQPH